MNKVLLVCVIAISLVFVGCVKSDAIMLKEGTIIGYGQPKRVTERVIIHHYYRYGHRKSIIRHYDHSRDYEYPDYTPWCLHSEGALERELGYRRDGGVDITIIIKRR